MSRVSRPGQSVMGRAHHRPYMQPPIHDGGYDEYFTYLRSGASHNNVHPDALLTLAKLHATEPAVGPPASRRLSDPVRQVS